MASSTTELTIDKIGGIFILVLITLFLATFLASIEFISKARQSSNNNKVSLIFNFLNYFQSKLGLCQH